MQLRDRFLKKFSGAIATILLLLFIAIFFSLMIRSELSFNTFGLKFLWSTEWDPVKQHFGALTAIVGTLVTSLIAVIIALPLSLGVAVLATNMVSSKILTGISIGLQI